MYRLQSLLESIYDQDENPGKIIIFIETKRKVELVSRYIRSFGVNCGVLHGDKSQGERDYVLREFRHGKSNILVATDVAARGLGNFSVSKEKNQMLTFSVIIQIRKKNTCLPFKWKTKIFFFSLIFFSLIITKIDQNGRHSSIMMFGEVQTDEIYVVVAFVCKSNGFLSTFLSANIFLLDVSRFTFWYARALSFGSSESVIVL